MNKSKKIFGIYMQDKDRNKTCKYISTTQELLIKQEKRGEQKPLLEIQKNEIIINNDKIGKLKISKLL